MKIFTILLLAMLGIVFIAGGMVAAIVAGGGALALSAISWDRGKSGGAYKELR